MKSKSLIALFFSLLGLTIDLSAQESRQEKPQPLQSSIADKKLKGVARPSQYNHRETDILAHLNTSTIPENFPKYKLSYTEAQYNLLMDNWYRDNSSLLKKETNINPEK